MTDPTPTETLRAAATKLREMAQAATPGPWKVSADRLETHLNLRLVACEDDKGDVTDWIQSGDAHLIATLGPTFAGLVADALDREASHWEQLDRAGGITLGPIPDSPLILLARHVLGEA